MTLTKLQRYDKAWQSKQKYIKQRLIEEVGNDKYQSILEEANKIFHKEIKPAQRSRNAGTNIEKFHAR